MSLSRSFEKSTPEIAGDLGRAGIVLITTDRYIASVFKSVLGAALLAIVPCIDTVWERFRSMHIHPMLDASSASPCCIDFINRWRIRASVTSPVIRSSAVNSRPAASRGTARHAWANRSEILSSKDNPHHTSLLIELARAHDHQSYSVEEAART